MFTLKKWFHFFSFFLVIVVTMTGFFQAFHLNAVSLEWKLGSGEGELFISSIFIFDLISCVFTLMVGGVSFMVLKYSYWYMSGSKQWNAFFITFFVFIFFMVLLSVSSSLFWVMLGWDGLGITSFCLVMFYSNWKSFNSALITFMMNRLGDFFFILAIWMSTTFFFLENQSFPWLGVLIVVTGMTKSAQIPFSAWLPAAMAAPTPVSSLVHSSTLVTAGIFIVVRFHDFLSSSSLSVLFFCSILTIILSGWSALGESDLKKIIALSTLSHLGFMMFFLSKSMIQATLIHLLVHAFFKSLLFMAAGVMIHSNLDNQDIRKMSSMNPTILIVLVIAVSANMGIPFLSGFYSKELLVFELYSGEFQFTLLESVVLMFSVFLTCCYSIRIIFDLLNKEYIHSSSETTSILNYNLLNWMLFSSLFSCFMGGLAVWVIGDPCLLVEKSIFLKLVKLTIFFLLLFAFFAKKMGITSLFFMKNSKMWFIYDFSKQLSEFYFKLSNRIFWEIDIKAILAKTPEMKGMFLEEAVFLKNPKKIISVSVLFLFSGFAQILLLNYN